jgi:3-oxoacyl-[acyl-carrier-protein] synthase-3
MSEASFLSMSFRTPSRRVVNRELEDRLGLRAGTIERLTGIRARHYLADGESLQSLAVEACWEAVCKSGLPPSAIDMLIFYSDVPPVMPEGGHFTKTYYDVSSHLHHLLKARGLPLGCECVAIGGSCVSFIFALEMAAGLIRSGLKQAVLIVGAATNSLFLENTDTNVAMTFGDGAAASLLVATREAGLVGFCCATDGDGFDTGRYDGYESLFVDRKRVAEFAPLALQRAAQGLFANTGLRLGDVDLFIPHQAGIRIIERGVALAAIPRDKIYLCLEEDGNTGAPAVQMALARAVCEGRVHDGDLIALLAFGTGWNYGAAAFCYHAHPVPVRPATPAGLPRVVAPR